MNAPFELDRQSNDFAAMIGQVDRWRGECIQQFAELERIVEDLLRQLKAAPRYSKQIRTGQPVGPAFKHLRELTGAKGPFASKSRVISDTLADLTPWFEWRAHLTHGTLALWRGRKNQWLLTLAHRPSADDVVRTYAITWDDAQNMRKLLKERTPVLCQNARSLANSVLKA